MKSFYTQEELINIGFGRIGENVLISRKASIYQAEKIEIANNVRIDDYCIISGKITLGNYVHIAAFCCLFAGDSGIEMADFSGLSSRVSVYAVSDDYSGEYLTNPTIPEIYKNCIEKKVYIGKHSIIGTGAVILPGALIPEGVSIGAMSLVYKELQAWSIYAGIPVKRVKERSRNLVLLEKKMMEKETKL